jgi:hypothetical protein
MHGHMNVRQHKLLKIELYRYIYLHFVHFIFNLEHWTEQNTGLFTVGLLPCVLNVLAVSQAIISCVNSKVLKMKL